MYIYIYILSRMKVLGIFPFKMLEQYGGLKVPSVW